MITKGKYLSLEISSKGIRANDDRRYPGQLWLTASSDAVGQGRYLYLIRRDFRPKEQLFAMRWSPRLWPRRR